MKQERFQMVMPLWLKNELIKIANIKGVSVSELIKDILKQSISTTLIV